MPASLFRSAAAQRAVSTARIAFLKALADGPARKLVGLSVEGKLPVREGAPVFVGDTQVGVITSGGFAPSVGAPIAMGYVAAGHNAVGTPLEAEVRGKRVPLAVASMPFIPHRYHRRVISSQAKA